MSEDTLPTACQAEGCIAIPEFVCEAWVMTPPMRGFLTEEVFLCAGCAEKFEVERCLSVVTDADNLDLVSVARWRDGGNSESGS